MATKEGMNLIIGDVKRKKVREAVWEFLVDYDKDNGNPAVDWAFILLHRLAEKGVVIKVDRELPDNAGLTFGDEHSFAIVPIKDIIEAGYVAVEPLIESK